MKCSCGNEIVKPDPSQTLTAAAGWCMPSEAFYELDTSSMECSDCRSRLLMMMTIGIDPGHNGENLKVKRGGIRYERSE
jgi:N-acetylmuramoyl-L-alanine amidase